MEDNNCSGCGLSFTDTLNPENERKYSSIPVVCHACAAKNMAAEDFRENASDYDKAGALFPITKDE